MKIALSAATILIVAAASTALAASDKSRPPLSQETKIKIGENPARDQIKTTFREVERKEVFDLPPRMVQLVVPQFWSNPSRELAKNYPPSALAVERVRGGVSQPCTTFYDRVNLAFVRARGFRLVGYSVEPTAPRYGHVLTSPVEAIAVQTSKGDVYTANLQNADQIRIRPPLFVKREGNYDVCWSGYRLSVTLEGPKGVNPFGFQRGGGRPRDR